MKAKIPGIEIACVISSTQKANGIQRALANGIPPEDVLVVNPREFPDKKIFGENLIRAMDDRNVTAFFQLGWLAQTPEDVTKEFEGFNLHPAHPKFGGKGMYGIYPQRAVLLFAHNVQRVFPFTQATIHRVTPEIDKGAVVDREYVNILPSDTPKDLQERVHWHEPELVIRFLRTFVAGKI